MAPKKRFDGKQVILVLLILATAGVLVAGYAAQAYQYENLLDLYAKSQSQLKQNGITPNTPSAGKVAQDGAAGSNGLPGVMGDKGARGATGDPGLDGIPGVAGQMGIPGIAGLDGASGTDGSPGSAGAAGAAGVNGLNGLDGSPGRGISTVGCVLLDNQTTVLRFTFTDLLTQDVSASCTPPTAATP